MKGLLLLFLIVTVSFSMPRSADAETITIGAEDDWFPFSGKPNGKPEGLAVEIVEAAYKSQGLTVKFESIPFARCMEDVKQGTLLGCFNAPENLLSDPGYIGHKEPLFLGEVLIYSKADSKENGLTAKDMEGKRVGLTNGYGYGDEIDKNTKVNREYAPSDISNIKKTAAGRVPYTLIYSKVFSHLEKTNPDIKGKLKPVGKISVDRLFLAFSKKFKDSEKYVEALNKGMDTIKKDGTYAKIESRWK